MKWLGACAALFTFLAPTAVSAQSAGDWLCIGDQVTGFSKKGGVWHSVDFTAGTRYIIKRSAVQGYAWEVREFGSSAILAVALCKADFNEAQFLFCTGLGGEFRFNSRTLRFLNAYLIGYVPGDTAFSKDGSDTPSIEIGTCSKL